jgi:hypothetical protein
MKKLRKKQELLEAMKRESVNEIKKTEQSDSGLKTDESLKYEEPEQYNGP